MKKTVILTIIICFLAVFQTSFLARFSVFNFLPSLVIFLVCFLSLFEKREEKSALALALVGGVLLDVFSSKPLGFSTVILLLVSLFIKGVVKRYVRIPAQERV